MAGVDAEISGEARVLDETLSHMPIDEDRDSNGASDEDNNAINNSKESHNGKIPSEDAYHPNVHLNSTMPPK